jgi:mono/diheme cytochrome c family protein
MCRIHTLSAMTVSMLLAMLSVTTATALVGCGAQAEQRTQQPDAAVTAMPRGARGIAMGPGMRGRGPGMMMGSSMQRHRWAMMGGIPAAYRGLRNPLAHSAKVISEGEALYRANCAACLGDSGAGNGPAAVGMYPPPANLRWLIGRPMVSDGYLMWAISEGGGGMGTAMPAFKDALSETERWKIIRYLEAYP